MIAAVQIIGANRIPNNILGLLMLSNAILKTDQSVLLRINLVKLGGLNARPMSDPPQRNDQSADRMIGLAALRKREPHENDLVN